MHDTAHCASGPSARRLGDTALAAMARAPALGLTGAAVSVVGASVSAASLARLTRGVGAVRLRFAALHGARLSRHERRIERVARRAARQCAEFQAAARVAATSGELNREPRRGEDVRG